VGDLIFVPFGLLHFFNFQFRLDIPLFRNYYAWSCVGDLAMNRSATTWLIGCGVAVAGGFAAGVATEPSPARPGENIMKNSSTHAAGLYLFVDDHWIAQTQALKRVLGAPEILPEPIIAPDDPRTERDCAWGNVIREPDGRWRMWYVTMHMGAKAGGPHEMAAAGVWGRGTNFSHHPRSPADVRETESMLVRYAESADGLRWRKPKLGLVEFRGNKENNIVLNGEGAARQTGRALSNCDGVTVVRDDGEADPAKRYKLIAHWETVHFWDNHPVSGALGRPADYIQRCAAARGKYLTCSPDGLRWNEPLKRIAFPDGGSDRFLVVRDFRHGQWWGYSRAAGYAQAALSTSWDLENWSGPAVARRLSAGGPIKQVESLIPFNYGNQDLGFLIGQDKDRGFMLAYLVAHHDGAEWDWIERDQPFIPCGPSGSYYATGAVPLHNEPFPAGDKLLIFFNAFSNKQEPPCPQGSRSIGLATLRRDGYAGLTTDSGQTGLLRTKPLKVSGNRLCVNVQPRGPGGTLSVALLTPDRAPISGYSLAEALPVTKDATRQAVGWKAQTNLAALKGREAVVEISIQGPIVLYALAFED
jgi:hypothetical protein